MNVLGQDRYIRCKNSMCIKHRLLCLMQQNPRDRCFCSSVAVKSKVYKMTQSGRGERPKNPVDTLQLIVLYFAVYVMYTIYSAFVHILLRQRQYFNLKIGSYNKQMSDSSKQTRGKIMFIQTPLITSLIQLLYPVA